MTERVSITTGKLPVLIVVPHGYDDPNTIEIGEQIISELDAFGVINHGWERADKFDYYNDKANCNNIEHINEDVIKDEFLNPILKFCTTATKYMFIIHGVSNSVKLKVGGNLDLIVGTGKGKTDSLSAPEWYSNLFMSQARKIGYHVFEGAAGGNYSGRSKNNLNQLFKQWHKGIDVFSLQVEIVKDLRATKFAAKVCGDRLSIVIEDMMGVPVHSAMNAPLQAFPTV